MLWWDATRRRVGRFKTLKKSCSESEPPCLRRAKASRLHLNASSVNGLKIDLWAGHGWSGVMYLAGTYQRSSPSNDDFSIPMDYSFPYASNSHDKRLLVVLLRGLRSLNLCSSQSAKLFLELRMLPIM